MNKKQEKTQEAIFLAFTNLISKKSYKNITIKEIIEDANIVRSTFYAHFNTKDEILKAICKNLFGHIFSEELNDGDSYSFSLTDYNVYTMISEFLYNLKDNKYIFDIMSYNNNELFLYYFKQYLNQIIKDYILPNIDINKFNVPENFIINHISSSFMGMIDWWIKKGVKDSPETLSTYFCDIIFVTM